MYLPLPHRPGTPRPEDGVDRLRSAQDLGSERMVELRRSKVNVVQTSPVFWNDMPVLVERMTTANDCRVSMILRPRIGWQFV